MSIDPIKILLVEEEQGDRAPLGTLLAQIVRTIPFIITHTQTLPFALEQLQTNSFDILLLDLALLGSERLVAFEQFNAQANFVPIILLSGLDDANLALEAVCQGAQDYLVKSQLDSRLLVRSIR
ncbi:response regulator [Lusitaniella coriacea LEGE 07157]|uniref:Response regulator n=1 Tax=Lusitaniella coriacea LEGE 07157 TaxID=945747 RepID=A0A8J7IVF7_9CYAN|nr:response regulator [Lusitaniella coriacea]MBE9118247.1 response regulator [Lusitaniella coriacea LEGE 07157]